MQRSRAITSRSQELADLHHPWLSGNLAPHILAKSVFSLSGHSSQQQRGSHWFFSHVLLFLNPSIQRPRPRALPTKPPRPRCCTDVWFWGHKTLLCTHWHGRFWRALSWLGFSILFGRAFSGKHAWRHVWQGRGSPNGMTWPGRLLVLLAYFHVFCDLWNICCTCIWLTVTVCNVCEYVCWPFESQFLLSHCK